MSPKSTHEAYDLLVVGAGTAGIVAAKTAARLGASTLVVERDRPGGDCLWTGCVPSKALLAAADIAASARVGHRLGVSIESVQVDFAQVMEHVRSAIETIAPVDSPESIEEVGAEYRQGTARFLGPGLAEVDGDQVAFTQAVITTGASPALPPIPGLAEVEPLTSDSIWQLTEAPQKLAVLGGGAIGCELGQAMARLGSEVTLVEATDRVLPNEDPEASAVIERSLRTDGLQVRLGAAVTAVKPAAAGAGSLELADGSVVYFDRLLVAIGRRPRTSEIGLEKVGVEVDERGNVIVDTHLRTTNKRIWAAGDLTGHPQFTHTAGIHGSMAAMNAILGIRRTVEKSVQPRVTYTSPEVASVGITTVEASGVHVLRVGNDHVDRAIAESDTDGFTKLAIDGKGKLLGATVVGPRAGETLGEITLAMQHGMRTRDLAGTTHAYPTYNDGPWNAAIEDIRAKVANPRTQQALSVVVNTRRRWLRWRDNA